MNGLRLDRRGSVRISGSDPRLRGDDKRISKENDMLGIGAHKQRMVDPAKALPGRDTPMPVRGVHHVHGRPIQGDFAGLETVQFGMG